MIPTIEEALRARTPELLAIPGVVGTGQGADGGRPVILVLVSARTPEVEARVPRTLDGHPVVLRVSGEVRGC
jgi:hypothetical protein